MWISAAEALRRLGVKPQSLYASVSRGRIRSRPDPKDPRRSLYDSADIARAARRTPGRRKAETVAREATRWGEPVLASAISTVSRGRLLYRGVDAVGLSEAATLEDVAQLLWQTPHPPNFSSAEPKSSEPFAALAEIAATMRSSDGRPAAALRSDSALVQATLAAAICGPGSELLHLRLAAVWRRPDAAEPLRLALVLLADHELASSTFAARIAVSTGASLAAGALAGLATLSGPLHGTAARTIGALVADLAADRTQTLSALRDWLGEGRHIPGFGHPLYPAGDPRAERLLASFVLPEEYAASRKAAEELGGEGANIDFALAALLARFALPGTATLRLFALSRCVGWLAHMLEQAAEGELIRPRARYTGVNPVT